MHVLFSSTPGYRHVQPMLRLAAALRDAGDEVMVAIAPELTSRIGPAGLTTVPAGGNFPAWWPELRRRHPSQPWTELAPARILHWFVPHLPRRVRASMNTAASRVHHGPAARSPQPTESV